MSLPTVNTVNFDTRLARVYCSFPCGRSIAELVQMHIIWGNGETSCGIATKWNEGQKLEGMDSCHVKIKGK